MRSISRRTFTKQLLAASAIPLAGSSGQEIHTDQIRDFVPPVPDSIAGYTLTAEDKQLVRKYIVNHEVHLLSLRGIELPNSVPPAITFCTLSMNERNGGSDDR